MPHVIYPMKTSIHTFSGHNTFSVRDIVVLKYVIPPFVDLHVYYLSNSCLDVCSDDFSIGACAGG